jgi:hypothetical protein
MSTVQKIKRTKVEEMLSCWKVMKITRHSKMPCKCTPNQAIMGKLVQDLQLFKGDLINFVNNIDATHVNSTSLNDIYEIICCCVISEISALWILYSLKIAFTVSRSKCVFVTVDVKLIPPLSFFLNVKFGGVLFNLSPMKTPDV